PEDGPALEDLDAAATVLILLVGGREAEAAPLPAERRPLVANPPVDRERLRVTAPVIDAAVLEVRVPAPAVGRTQLVRDRVADRPLPADRRELLPDDPVHLVSASGRRPVDRPALEDGVMAAAVRGIAGSREPAQEA